MNRYLSPRARGVAAALAVLMGLTVAAPPASAAGAPTTQSQTTLATAAAAKVAASLDTAAAVAPAQDTAGGGATESKPFLKSGKGIAAVILMVGATAWLVKSRKGSDVVHSPGRN